MCFASSVPEPTPIQQPASFVDSAVQQARDDTKRKQRAAAGANSTRVAQDQTMTTGKTLLGQ